MKSSKRVGAQNRHAVMTRHVKWNRVGRRNKWERAALPQSTPTGPPPPHHLTNPKMVNGNVYPSIPLNCNLPFASRQPYSTDKLEYIWHAWWWSSSCCCHGVCVIIIRFLRHLWFRRKWKRELWKKKENNRKCSAIRDGWMMGLMAHSTIENAHTCQRLAQQSRERLGLSLLNFWWSSLLSRHTIPRPFFYPGSRPRLCQWKFLSDCECRWFQKKNFVFLPPL